MRHRTALLRARRDLLVARSGYLRADLQFEAAAIGRRVRFVDRAIAFSRSGPGRVVLVSGAVLLLLTGPRRLLRIVGRLSAAWPMVQPWLSGSLGRLR